MYNPILNTANSYIRARKKKQTAKKTTGYPNERGHFFMIFLGMGLFFQTISNTLKQCAIQYGSIHYANRSGVIISTFGIYDTAKRIIWDESRKLSYYYLVFQLNPFRIIDEFGDAPFF